MVKLTDVDRCQLLNYSIHIAGGLLIGKHPNKHIRAAIETAISNGWVVEKTGGSGHAFATLRCGISEHREHSMSINSTPSSPENHAKQILRMVKKCSPKGNEQAPDADQNDE